MLRVDGKNILDDGFSGSNVTDTENRMRFTKEGAANLVSSVRMGMGQGIDFPGNSSNLIGKTSAIIAESIGKNTQELQKLLLDQGDGTKEKINDIVKALSDSQEKNGKELLRAVESITEKIEELRLESGEDGDKMIELLGLDKAKDSLNNFTPSSHPLADRFNRYIGASSGQSAMSGLAQIARQPSLLLGFRPRAGTSVEDRVRANFVRRRQNQGINETLGALSPTAAGELGATPAMTPASTFTTGIDRDPSNIEKTLVEMKKLLQQIADCGCPDNSSIIDGLGRLALLTAAVGVGVGAFSYAALKTSMGNAFESMKQGLSNFGFGPDPIDLSSLDVGNVAGLAAGLGLGTAAGQQLPDGFRPPMALPGTVPATVPVTPPSVDLTSPYNPYGVTMNEDGTVNVPNPAGNIAGTIVDFFSGLNSANQAARNSGGQYANSPAGNMPVGIPQEQLENPAPNMSAQDKTDAMGIAFAVAAGVIGTMLAGPMGPIIGRGLASLVRAIAVGVPFFAGAAMVNAEEISSMPLMTSDAIENMTPTERQAAQQIIQNIDNSQQILQNAAGRGGGPVSLRQRPDTNSQERYQDSRTGRAYGQGARE